MGANMKIAIVGYSGSGKSEFTSIQTYKLLTIKLLYSMFLINYYIGAFAWK
jgi:dephospho-CoA kinase